MIVPFAAYRLNLIERWLAELNADPVASLAYRSTERLSKPGRLPEIEIILL